MKNKKILITGGAGFIGSNLSLELQEKYPDNKYYIIDNFLSGNLKNLSDFKGEIITKDVSKVDLDKLFPNGLDIIFHQAAITDTTIKDKDKMNSANIDSFKNLLDFALKHKARLIYASSAAVYGHSNPPMIVNKKEKPANVYGFSKLVADNIARKHFKDIPIIGLRYFNVYGPKEKYKNKMASMIWQLYSQMKDDKNPKIFEYGEQKRDQIYVKDIVKANILAIKAKKSGIFNVGTGKATTFNEIIETLNNVLNKNLKTEYIKNPYSHYQEFTKADLKETKKVLQYEPEYDIKKGIKDYMENID